MKIPTPVKKKFLKRHHHLADKAFGAIPSDDASRRLAVKARKELRYSDKTQARDIEISLARIWHGV